VNVELGFLTRGATPGAGLTFVLNSTTGLDATR
jgi:hypothetical protein